MALQATIPRATQPLVGKDGTVTPEWFRFFAALGGSGFQPLDGDLTAIAALDATAGLLTKTAADTYARRTITGTANEVAVADGDGASANPTLSLPATLALRTKTVQVDQLAFAATQSASADANTLDDYEEGTFTPTIAFGGASTGVVYTTQTGVYTKIGNLVTFSIALAISNNGSSTGDTTIGTLPFTPGVNVPVLGRPANYTIGAGLVPIYDTNGTSIRLRTLNPTTGNVAEAQDSQVDADFSILLAGAFRV